MKDFLKEEIKLDTELIKIVAVAILADITGLLSLFLSNSNRPVEILLINLGIFTNFILSVSFLLQVEKLYFKIKKLTNYDHT